MSEKAKLLQDAPALDLAAAEEPAQHPAPVMNQWPADHFHASIDAYAAETIRRCQDAGFFLSKETAIAAAHYSVLETIPEAGTA